jgi:hypothetical protein
MGQHTKEPHERTIPIIAVAPKFQILFNGKKFGGKAKAVVFLESLLRFPIWQKG